MLTMAILIYYVRVTYGTILLQCWRALLSWDIHTKLLLKEYPQDFVSYFAPGARYIGTRETHFQTRVDSAYEQREMRGDLAIEAEENGEHFLITPEFQSTKDEKMDERLLGYSYEATRLSNLNVLSVVFYLLPVHKVPQPPLKRKIPNGFQSICFDYLSIELGKMLAAEIQSINLDSFWPWMVLCKDGANCATVDRVLNYLHSKGRANLILLTRFYANMVLTSAEDQEWLQRRFKMLQEFLWENTSVYQNIREMEEERGIELGIELGIEKGRIEEAQQNIEIIVQERFPDLLALAKSQIEPVTNLAQLQELFLAVFRARTAEETEQILSNLQ